MGVWLGFVLIAKIMYTSSDQYRTTNKFDLVLFKPPSKSAGGATAIGPRRIYSNNNANLQNLNAAAASGVDFSILNVRTSFSNTPNNNNNSNNQNQADYVLAASSSSAAGGNNSSKLAQMC